MQFNHRHMLVPGMSMDCQAPNGRQCVATVLGQDQALNEIVHVALTVFDARGYKYGDQLTSCYQLVFVPINYFNLCDSATRIQNGIGIVDGEQYADDHSLWLDAHLNDMKPMFSTGTKEVIELFEEHCKELRFGENNVPVTYPAFIPLSEPHLNPKYREKLGFVNAGKETGKMRVDDEK